MVLNYDKKLYDIILLDPPWPYHEHSDKRQPFAADHYGLMSYEDIATMPVKDYLTKNGIVFIWATSPKLHMAINAISEWGLAYRGIAHVWVKTTKDGRILNGSGVRPTYSKAQSELLLFATIKAKGRPMPLANEALPHQVLHKRIGHSVKPDVFQDLIDTAYPIVDGSINRLELFARRFRDGWHSTGIELTGHDYTTGCSLAPSND